MKIFDVRNVPAAVDAQLAVVENPKHRHVLKNFRRHALLEVSGFWQDILIPTMTVEQPVYRVTERGKTHVFAGMDAVRDFYAATAAGGGNVFGPLEEHVAVTDHGLFTEALFANVVRGSHPSLAGEDVEPDGVYQVTHHIGACWPYRDGLLVGEHIYEESSSWTVTELDPSALTSPEDARRMLAPYLADSPLSEIEEGLKLFQ